MGTIFPNCTNPPKRLLVQILAVFFSRFQTLSMPKFRGSLDKSFILTPTSTFCLLFSPPRLLSAALLLFAPLGIEYLKIIPRARVGSESIANEAEGRMGY